MAAPTPREEDVQRADELRRRLYRPDATEAERQEYQRLIAAGSAGAPAEPAPVVPEAQEEPQPPTASTRRRRGLVLAGAAVVLGVLVLAAVVQQTAAPTLLLPLVPTQRATTGPAPDEPVVRVAPSGETGVLEFRGRGPGTAPLDPVSPSGSDGRLMIRITVGDAAPVRWQARRVETRLDGDQVVRTLGEGGGRQRRADPTTYGYRGTPPTSLRIDVPTGTTWDLVVAPAR